MCRVAYWLSLVMVFAIPSEDMLVLPAFGTVCKLVGFLLFVSWIAAVVSKGRPRSLSGFHLVTALFVLWNGASALWSVEAAQTLVRFSTYVQLFVLIVIFWDLYTTPAAIRAALQAYVLGAYVVIGGIVLNYLTSNTGRGGRISAEGFDPNAAGLILALGIPVAWYSVVASLPSAGKHVGVLRFVNCLYVPFAVFAVLLTASRGSLIATFPGLLFVALTTSQLKPRLRVLTVFALVGALCFAVPFVPKEAFDRLSGTYDSISSGDMSGRVNIWRSGAAVFANRPYLGVGGGGFHSAVGGHGAHNSFLAILVDVGVIGFGLFSVVVLHVVRDAFRHPRLEASFWIAILLILLLGNVNQNWEQKKQNWLFVSLVAVSASLYVKRPRSTARSSIKDNAPMQPAVGSPCVST